MKNEKAIMIKTKVITVLLCFVMIFASMMMTSCDELFGCNACDSTKDCTTCAGTGWLNDGVNNFRCHICNGSGRCPSC
jgi:hypothetical protein